MDPLEGTDASQFPSFHGADLLTTLVGGGLAIAVYEALRRVLSHPTAHSSVIAIQVWRTAGAAFLILRWLGQLPPLIAMPAGWGDVVVGLPRQSWH